MDDAYLDDFQRAGALEVVPESLETSLMLGAHALLMLGVPPGHVTRRTRQIRAERYQLLRGLFHSDEFWRPETIHTARRLAAVIVPEHWPPRGVSLQELDLERCGVLVTALRHGTDVHMRPPPHALVFPQDELMVYGMPDALQCAVENVRDSL